MEPKSLIQAARGGDRASYNALVLTFQNEVYNLTFWILGGETAAVEATQAAFLQAYRDLSHYREGVFRNFLFQKAIVACKRRLQHSGRRRSVLLLSSSSAKTTPCCTTDLVTEPVAGQALQHCLSTLPVEQRLAAVLVDVEGFDYCQAAEILGIKPNQVRYHLSLARQTLCLRLT